MKFTDLIKMFKKCQGLITEVKHCFSDYYTVKVIPQQGFTWVAGEYAMFFLKDKKIQGRRWRVFSLASVSDDGYILLGFRTGKKPSAYKQFIIDHGLNAAIDIRGPVGDFTLKNDTRPVVLFASGVGITPIFSILKSIRNDLRREVHMVYASSEKYLFKDEIDSIAQTNPNIHLSYVRQREEAQAKLTGLAKSFGNDAYYYTAGSGRVIESTRSLLRGEGIEKRNILSDHFEGYQ